MKDNLTAIIFLLDKSGSMAHLVNDTIGGYNSFIENQKKEDGEAVVATVLFNTESKMIHNNVDLKEIQLLTTKDYFTTGGTALYDAIGNTINGIGYNFRILDEKDRPSKVIFVITTDGEENSSKEFTKSKITNMIKHQQEKYGWQFMFLGADLNSVNEAKDWGINYATNYTTSSVGIDSVYTTMGNTVKEFRNTGVINDNWNDTIK